MKNIVSFLFCCLFYFNSVATTISISGTNDRKFNPSAVTVRVGDTINFRTFGFHDAVEVSKATWDTDDTIGLAGGFRVPLSGGIAVMQKTGTLYYVCTPHVKSNQMKGIITVLPAIVNKTVTISGTNDRKFNPSSITVNFGDTINFRTFGFHDAVEVSKATWDANDTAALAGGFKIPLAGGTTVLRKLGTIYYVCTPHVKSDQMKGIIEVIDGSVSVPVVNTIVIKNDSAKTAFVPSVINAVQGDTIDFQLAADVNAQEISKTTYDNNGSTRNGGFFTLNGGGKVVMNRVGTIYYSSEKYSLFGMKGIINVRERGDFYIAKVSGIQEEFPFAGRGNGTVTARLDGDTLFVTGGFSNLTGDYTNAHFHRALAGTSGGVQIALTPAVDSTKKSGTFNAKYALTSAQKDMLKNRELYVNIHSSVMPGGEIRGQVLPESDAYYQANIFGSEEVPSIMSSANGAIVAELKGSSLTISGSAKGLVSGYTNSHLHLGYPGQNGGVQIALKPTVVDSSSVQFKAGDNTYNLTANQLASLKAGQLYVNIHSRTWPGGEIRGQVMPMATAKFRAYLTGANELVPVLTQASGGIIANLIDSTLTIVGSFNGLESNWNGGAHFHRGMTGQNGGVQFAIKPVANADNRGGIFLGDSNTIKLSATNLDDLFARRLYANIHSASNAGGEIRGQVLPECQFVMLGAFTGMQENKPILSTGRGGVAVEVLGNRVILSGYAERLLDKVNRSSGAHIHRGAVGQNGGVIQLLSYSFPTADSLSIVFPASSNTYTASVGFLDSLKSRLFYANVHTARVGSGEIRAQLNHEALAVFHSILSGAGETNPVNTKAVGGVMVELSGRNAILHGSFAGLESKWNGGSHIHGGLPGTNGGVRFNLFPTMNADSTAGIFAPAANNTNSFSDGNIDSLRKRLFYVNVHTQRSPGGEIRGTLHGMSQAIFNANVNGLNELPITASTGIGAVKAEIFDNRMTVIGSFNNLSGEFNGGAHIHTGNSASAGGVIFGLKTVVNADKKGGQFVVDSNQFTITPDQVLNLAAGSMYANIHSTTNVGGEIRGQLLPDPNFFPAASAIISPTATDTVKLAIGTKDSIATTSWSVAADPDGNQVVYKIQSALLPDFGLIISTGFMGTATSLSVPVKTLDSTLAAPPLSLPKGASITIPTRIIASDGSLNTIGTPTLITFQRAITTGVHDEFVKTYTMSVFPVPAYQQATIEINAIKSGSMDMQVVDLNGKTNHVQKIHILQGINRVSLDVANYPTGTYFIQMIQNGRKVAYFKLQKQ